MKLLCNGNKKKCIKICILIILIYVITAIIGDFIGQTLSKIMWGNTFVSATPYIDTLIADLLCVLCIVAFFRIDNIRTLYLKRSGVKECAGNIICCFLIILFFSSAIFSFASLFNLSKESAWNEVEDVSVILKGACIVVLSPICEELVFRRGLFGVIRSCSNWIVATLISSLFFGIVHGIDVNALNAFMIGVILCLLYERSGTLFAPIILHMVNNGFAVLSAGSTSNDINTGGEISVVFAVLFLLIAVTAFIKLYKETRAYQVINVEKGQEYIE